MCDVCGSASNQSIQRRRLRLRPNELRSRTDRPDDARERRRVPLSCLPACLQIVWVPCAAQEAFVMPDACLCVMRLNPRPNLIWAMPAALLRCRASMRFVAGWSIESQHGREQGTHSRIAAPTRTRRSIYRTKHEVKSKSVAVWCAGGSVVVGGTTGRLSLVGIGIGCCCFPSLLVLGGGGGAPMHGRAAQLPKARQSEAGR